MPATIPPFVSRKKSIFLIALLILAMGQLVLIGWIFDSNFLRTFLSDGASMKVNSAILIIFAGAALLFLNDKKPVRARLLLYIILIFAALIIVEYLLNINLGIDEFLIKDLYTKPRLETPGRTSLLTCINLIIVATAMLLASYGKQMAQLLAGLVFISACISLIGHLFHINNFYYLGRFSGIAFHTSLALLLLSVGVFLIVPQAE